MSIRKTQVINALRRKYRIRSFNGLGQCTLTRCGNALKGEPRIVKITVPESIGYALLPPATMLDY